MTIDIVGHLNDEQKKDMLDAIDNRKNNLRVRANKIYEKHQAKLVKQGIPFCFTCAVADYRKQQEELFTLADTKRKYQRELHDQGLAYTENNIPVPIDLETFGENYFTIEEQQQKAEVDARTRKKYVTYYDAYRCKGTPKRHWLSIQRKVIDEDEAINTKKK